MLRSVSTFLTTRRRRHPLAADIAFASFMTVLTVIGSVGEAHPNQAQDRLTLPPVPPWPAYLLVAAAGAALFWRHRRPRPVFAVALAATLAYTVGGYENGAALLNPVVALYALAATARSPQVPGAVGSIRAAVVAAVLTLAALAGLTAAFNPFGAFGGGFVLIPGEVAVALFAGLAVANQRAYVEAIRQRADLAEQTRDDEARRRVDAERLRIARELHDVVAHTMSTINLQAGVAVHVGRDLPEQVAAALASIRDASKNGLRELRAILAVLRQVDESEPTGPTPDLAELPALVETVRAAGLPVEVEVSGDQRRLPPAIELAAYRIVQESLTNTLRHAGPATVVVRLGYGDGRLDVEVVDTGAGVVDGSDAGGAGHGLIGMRERALAADGTLSAGPGSSGGFRVSARLPIGETS
jgi:signal transduction histidine kinase